MRFVNGKLAVRLSSAIDAMLVEKLNIDFSDILTADGKIYLSPALPDESDEPEISDLPRLILDFNCKDYGRLRCLINTLNSF